MLTHILRDHAIRVLPWWLGIGAAITLHLYVISLHPDFQTAPWALVPWFPLALYLLLIRDGRASELDLTLPIPARRLWLAHLLALGLGAAAVLAVSAVLMALRAQVVGEPGAVAEVMVTALRAVKGWLDALLVFTEAFAGQLAAVLPGGEAALRILSAFVLGAAYVLAEARFRRFEVVPDPGQDDYWYFADLQPYLKMSPRRGAN